ncbi:MAG: hypothetical protein AAGD10_08270 [Myxococcota bacterium]
MKMKDRTAEHRRISLKFAQLASQVLEDTVDYIERGKFPSDGATAEEIQAINRARVAMRGIVERERANLMLKTLEDQPQGGRFAN